VCVRPILAEEAAMVERTGGSRHGYAGLSDRSDLDSQDVNSSSFSSPGTPPLQLPSPVNNKARRDTGANGSTMFSHYSSSTLSSW
jgi:hypothetical protein